MFFSQKRKILKNNACLYGTRHFRGHFPLEANISPYEPQADEINFISSFSHNVVCPFKDRYTNI